MTPQERLIQAEADVVRLQEKITVLHEQKRQIDLQIEDLGHDYYAALAVRGELQRRADRDSLHSLCVSVTSVGAPS